MIIQVKQFNSIWYILSDTTGHIFKCQQNVNMAKICYLQLFKLMMRNSRCFMGHFLIIFQIVSAGCEGHAGSCGQRCPGLCSAYLSWVMSRALAGVHVSPHLPLFLSSPSPHFHTPFICHVTAMSFVIISFCRYQRLQLLFCKALSREAGRRPSAHGPLFMALPGLSPYLRTFPPPPRDPLLPLAQLPPLPWVPH